MRTGIPLGILEEAQWQEKSISFQPQDVFLLYTDGVTEAQNSAGDFFERARLAALLRRNADRSAEEIRGVLLGELAQFTGEADPHDDVTMVVMTYTHDAPNLTPAK
jgi:sigma-B regulation protein RsbU (phosphoserine phosphatase)